MKIPFRQQVTDFDCVPTTFINAISYLFHRSEVPPFILHRIYKECLDGDSSRGTTSRAIRELGFLLSNYRDKRHKKFVLESQYLRCNQVHLGKGSSIVNCINNQGVALLNINSNWGSFHLILGIKIEDDWLHCFDPAPRTRRFTKNELIQFNFSAQQQEPNLRIRCDWLNKKNRNLKNPEDRKYVLGYKDDRECLLLRRINS